MPRGTHLFCVDLLMGRVHDCVVAQEGQLTDRLLGGCWPRWAWQRPMCIRGWDDGFRQEPVGRWHYPICREIGNEEQKNVCVAGL